MSENKQNENNIEQILKDKIEYIKMLEEINAGLRRYLNEMIGVYRLLEAMNTIKDLDRIYDLIVDILSSTIPFNSYCITIYDEKSKNERIVKQLNLEEIEKYKNIFNVDKGVYEWVFKKKHMAIVPKGNKSENIDISLFNKKSLAIVPLIANEKRIGYVEILINKAENEITQQELSLVTILLNQASVIIENLIVYEMEQEALRKLKEIDELKSDIITTASHELRTPLTILKGSSRIIEIKMNENMWDEEDKKLYLELIHNVNTQAEIMEEIINTLLTATKFESGTLILQKKATNIKQLIESVLKKFSYKTKIMKLKFICPDPSVSALVDPDELKKVIRNLLSNAYKFSPENSEVIITLTSDEKSFMISVKDHGIGISKDEQDKIFDKFYRIDRALTRKNGGIGFGLYVSKLIVEQHGGNIFVESEPGAGSTFYVRIPKK